VFFMGHLSRVRIILSNFTTPPVTKVASNFT
jgi:hypothetical protein